MRPGGNVALPASCVAFAQSKLCQSPSRVSAAWLSPLKVSLPDRMENLSPARGKCKGVIWPDPAICGKTQLSPGRRGLLLRELPQVPGRAAEQQDDHRRCDRQADQVEDGELEVGHHEVEAGPERNDRVERDEDQPDLGRAHVAVADRKA